jgi:hypothetical protein
MPHGGLLSSDGDRARVEVGFESLLERCQRIETAVALIERWCVHTLGQRHITDSTNDR